MFIADFHIHSRYSRATSRECVPEWLDWWARRKGLHLIGTGDFTHPGWRRELEEQLEPAEEGLYRLKKEFRQSAGVAGGEAGTRFLVTGEISSIYKKGGRVRKVHNLILLPGLEQAEALSRRLEAIGNLHSDGRPILGLDSRDLLEITLESCPEAVFIPAHIWTPHFSLFGAYSGFDDIYECFGDMTKHIHALETGLSSNPPMNWRLSALDSFVLVSNSDAHSPANLAREANLLDTEMSYPHIARALEGKGGFRGTLEFYPEEGKYHWDGHRKCGVCQSPGDTLAGGGACPVCGGRITVGVLHRVEELADREEGFRPGEAAPFESIIPLPEVIAASTGHSPKSRRGAALYDRLLRELGSELHILRHASPADVELLAGPLAAEGIRRLRRGEVEVTPGYDGAYGKVKILDQGEREQISGQIRLFAGERPQQPPPAEGRDRKPPKRAVKKAASGGKGPVSREHGLNPEQRAAVLSTAPVTAVAAGPGTGKTRTLAARIAHLVEVRRIAPSHITAVTFTNKAAAEMRGRLERELGGPEKVGGMAIATFHSLCLDLLRRGGRKEAVIDSGAAELVVRDVLEDLEEKGSPRDLLRRISREKCGAPGEEPVAPEILRAYNARLEEYGVWDYDDILLQALEQGVGEAERNRFQHLLVDEYQDVNPVQYKLIREWGRESKGIFVIGDPDQAIYGFRGSDSRCFRWLGEAYPRMEKIHLTRNYRSTPEILRAARPVAGNLESPPLEAQRESGPLVRLQPSATPFEEALYVVKEINRMVGGIDMLASDSTKGSGGIRGFSEIGVLYRTNRQAALLEECMAQEGIPYVVAGRDGVLSHPEAAKFLAFFRLLLHPGDMAALWSVLKEQAGIGGGELREMAEKYRLPGGDPEILAALLEKRGERACALARRLRRFRQAATSSTEQLVTCWAEETGQTGAVWVDKLLHMAVFHRDMEDLLRTVALGQEGDLRRYGGSTYSGDAVTLTTLHGSKGLEFPVVFLCGVSHEYLPHRSRDGRVSPVEEERRLLYVGMTRAMEELTLLYAGEPSPFLADIPGELLDTGEARRRGASPDYRQVSLFE